MEGLSGLGSAGCASCVTVTMSARACSLLLGATATCFLPEIHLQGPFWLAVNLRPSAGLRIPGGFVRGKYPSAWEELATFRFFSDVFR